MILKNLFKKKKDSSSFDEDEELAGLNGEAQDMVRGVIQLSRTTVKEVMVPRIDVFFLSADSPKDELLEKISGCGFSRVPIFKETIDNVIGIAYVKDILHSILREEEIDLMTILRKPYFVPESKRLDSLLREFKRRRVHIAVSVDEYGGVSGIVCLEDILEEIVGDIQDEFDNENEDFLKLDENVYLCDARMDIEDFNEKMGSFIPDTDFDTLGGFVFNLFGRIPGRYEKVSYADFDFVIHTMEGRKIKTIKIIHAPKRVQDDEE